MTRDGRIVWEYINPYCKTKKDEEENVVGAQNHIYRAYNKVVRPLVDTPKKGVTALLIVAGLTVLIVVLRWLGREPAGAA